MNKYTSEFFLSLLKPFSKRTHSLGFGIFTLFTKCLGKKTPMQTFNSADVVNRPSNGIINTGILT